MSLLRCGLLCNDAALVEKDGHTTVDGDPTEGALLVSAEKFGIDEAEEYRRYDEVPFSSERKFMATLHTTGGDENLISVKGAPEKIIEFCNDVHKDELTEIYRELAERGMRVLGFDGRTFNGDRDSIDLEDEARRGLDFYGFQAIIDPPRESAIEAIRATERSGIKTVMLTGDNRMTAGAIARTTGIFEDDDRVRSGSELDADDSWLDSEEVERTAAYTRPSLYSAYHIPAC